MKYLKKFNEAYQLGYYPISIEIYRGKQMAGGEIFTTKEVEDISRLLIDKYNYIDNPKKYANHHSSKNMFYFGNNFHLNKTESDHLTIKGNSEEGHDAIICYILKIRNGSIIEIPSTVKNNECYFECYQIESLLKFIDDFCGENISYKTDSDEWKGRFDPAYEPVEEKYRQKNRHSK